MPISSKIPPSGGMAFRSRAAPPSSRSSTGAFLDGLQDSFTFGLGDHVKAGLGTVADAFHGKSLVDAYKRHIAAEHEYDRIDAREHGAARGWGKGAGTALQLVASGPLGAVARGGVRMAEVTPLALRELGALGAVGAGGGLATQAGTDAIAHRRSSLRDYAAAAAGGTVEALVTRSGQAGRAGAAGSATSSVVSDILNGHMPSGKRAAKAASEGAFLGAGAGALGRKLANALPTRAYGNLISKEGLGEAASVLRTIARGDWTKSRAKRQFILNPDAVAKKNLPLKKGEEPEKIRRTFPDQRTVRGQLVESKFGLFASLSERQREAWEKLGKMYRVDHLLPMDVGSFFAHPTVQAGYQAQRGQDRRR